MQKWGYNKKENDFLTIREQYARFLKRTPQEFSKLDELKAKKHTICLNLTSKQSEQEDSQDECVNRIIEKFKLPEENFIANNTARITCKLLVNYVLITFEIDTGAPVTIISITDAYKYFRNLKLQPADIQLFSYCQTRLLCFGYVNVTVKSKIVGPPLKLYVVQSDRQPILGREWLRQIKIDWAQILDQQIQSAIRPIQRDIPEKWNDKVDKIKIITDRYPLLFANSFSIIQGYEARILLKNRSIPKFAQPKRVPFYLRQTFYGEILTKVEAGFLLPVKKSEWATSIALLPKRHKRFRLCGDYNVTINPQLKIEQYSVPMVDEIYGIGEVGRKFSKIEIAKELLHLSVHPEDRHLLTICTPKGLYQPTVLLEGIAGISVYWQDFLENLLEGIPGVLILQDGIRISADTDDIHLQRIDEVLHRLNKCEARVNLNKCEWMKDHTEFCGHLVHKTEVTEMDDNIEAIIKMKRPSTKDEVRAIIGIISYYKYYVQDISTIIKPLNCLLQSRQSFSWNVCCERSFNEIKRILRSDSILAHHNDELPLILAVDACTYGVAAVLSHRYTYGTEKPIQFVSQSLSNVQQRYSQVDLDAYAIYFGIQKFRSYLYARMFTLVISCNHIPYIYPMRKELPSVLSTRIQRFAVFLQSFNYKIILKSKTENANAVGLSRLPNCELRDAQDDFFDV